MAYNKVTYRSKTLIDLTGDTVTADKLLTGVKAHNKSGAVITGTFLQGYPSSFEQTDVILDTSGNAIKDSSGNDLYGTYIYVKQ